MRSIIRTSVVTLMSLLFFTAPLAAKVEKPVLVTDETIAAQKRLTTNFTLKNGIPVTYRKVPDSEILEVVVTFSHGLKDLKVGQKALNQWLWATMPMAAAGYPKDKVFELTEKYAIEMSCSGGIEMSSCALGTVDDFWGEALPLFAAVVKTPSLTAEDAALTKDRLTAELRSTPTNPGNYVNEIVNKVYYPKGHPYRLNHDEALEELGKLTRDDMAAYHRSILSANLMRIVVVGSLPEAALKKDLEGAFGTIAKSKTEQVAVEPPPFDPKTALAFEHRAIPTAYIRAKIVSPSITDKDAVASRLMYEILSEELGEEIRTKRSLSYAVYSYVIQYSQGIGVLSATTSNPKETLAAMTEVIDRLKTKTYSEAELDEYKRVFATSYYLTQETHASLAGAIATNLHYFGTTDRLYEMPRLLDRVTPADIKRLANEILVDFRMGVIFDKDKFEEAWARALIDKYRSKKTH